MFKTLGNALKNKEIRFKNVSLIKNNLNILENINFRIKPSKINAIIGKNASGKSSIISLLIQNVKQTSGEITIDNKNINMFSLGIPTDFAVSLCATKCL